MIALNCVGRLSKIYNNVAAETFGVVDRFHSICAKLLGQKACFQTLTDTSMQLSGDSLEKCMGVVLEQEMKSGSLDKAEVERMTQFMMGQLDTAQEGFVTLPEYLIACNSSE